MHVEGSLKMDTWDDKTTGEKRTKIKVHADRVQFLDRRDDSSTFGPSQTDDEGTPTRRPAGNGTGRGGYPAPGPRKPSTPISPSQADDQDEDIPF